MNGFKQKFAVVMYKPFYCILNHIIMLSLFRVDIYCFNRMWCKGRLSLWGLGIFSLILLIREQVQHLQVEVNYWPSPELVNITF